MISINSRKFWKWTYSNFAERLGLRSTPFRVTVYQELCNSVSIWKNHYRRKSSECLWMPCIWISQNMMVDCKFSSRFFVLQWKYDLWFVSWLVCTHFRVLIQHELFQELKSYKSSTHKWIWLFIINIVFVEPH